MSYLLVWVLVNSSPHGVLSYSPPMQTEKECKALIDSLGTLDRTFSRNKCIQIKMGVALNG